VSRALVTIRTDADRSRVATWAAHVAVGTRVEFKQTKRSIPQNDRMWAMLTDVATQVPWHGSKMSPDDWKLIFLDALKREVRTVPNIDGTGFVALTRSSDLSKEEMSDLMELISMFGAKHGVLFADDVAMA
jgi:hypothetical protein